MIRLSVIAFLWTQETGNAKGLCTKYDAPPEITQPFTMSVKVEYFRQCYLGPFEPSHSYPRESSSFQNPPQVPPFLITISFLAAKYGNKTQQFNVRVSNERAVLRIIHLLFITFYLIQRLRASQGRGH